MLFGIVLQEYVSVLPPWPNPRCFWGRMCDMVIVVPEAAERMAVSIARFRFGSGQSEARTENGGPARRAEGERDYEVSSMIGASVAPSPLAPCPT